MKNKKIFAFSLCLAMFTSSAYAVIDPPNVMENLKREIQSAIEVVENIINNLQLEELNTLLGDKGGISPQVVDMASQLDYKKYAPTLTQDLQNVVGGKGFESIPDVRQYVQSNLTTLNSTNVTKQTAAVREINERLNLSAMDSFQTAKNVSALTNKTPSEDSSQLSKAGAAKDMHNKLVQEAAQDIQGMKRDVSQNQLIARLLETKAVSVISDIRNSTPENNTTEQNESNVGEKENE